MHNSFLDFNIRHDKTLTDGIDKTIRILTIIPHKLDKNLFQNIHQIHSIIMFYLFFFLGFKFQHTMENLNDKKENQKIKESEIAKEALIELLKITVFMIKKNIAHTHNYEDFVKFIGSDLEDDVFSKFLSVAKSHKSTTYVTANTVKQFVNVIGNWMREKSLETIKSCDYLTLMIGESTDEE